VPLTGPRIGKFTQYLGSIAVVVLCTLVAVALRSKIELTSLAMIYIFGVLVVSVRYGRSAAVLNAVLGVTAFFYFCVPVHDSFVVEDYSYLITLSAMLAVALVISGLVDRVRAQSDKVRDAELRIRTESMKNSLLSAVSHDIKTPLAAMYGAATSLLEEEGRLDPAQARGLIEGIAAEAERLNRVVTNILDMTRLESGIEVRKDWYPLEEIVGAALSRFEAALSGRSITINIPPDLSLVCVDDVLLEQLFVNLIDNFVKYTDAGTPLRIDAVRTDQTIVITVQDKGHGFPSGAEERVFEKFFRGQTSGVRGAGLGLAICRAIVNAHNGTIKARTLPDGGALVSINLPIGGSPPDLTEIAESSTA
jgi:K+-sensing histidine kinase KdpD